MRPEWFPERGIVIDLETTGLDTRTCEPIEIAVGLFSPEQAAASSWLAKATSSLPREIVEATGITDELLSREAKEDQRSSILRLNAFLLSERAAGLPMVGHNYIRYDQPVLASTFARHGVPLPPALQPGNAFDTAALYKGWRMTVEARWRKSWSDFPTHLDFARYVLGTPIKGLRYALGVVCEELKVDVSYLTAHRAKADIEMTLLVLKRLKETTCGTVAPR